MLRLRRSPKRIYGSRLVRTSGILEEKSGQKSVLGSKKLKFVRSGKSNSFELWKIILYTNNILLTRPMLPNIYYQCYQNFTELLQGLQQAATAPKIDASRLRQDLMTTQQFFQQRIASLDNQDVAPAVESRLRSLQTEIHKQLNLLSMDVTFLQAARQPQTLQTRQQQITQRLQILRGYCETILAGVTG
jgi:hypothetical protein